VGAQCRVVLGMAVMLSLLAGPAMGDITLNYLGAFNTGLSGAYGGDVAFNPAGNGGAGSLFLSRSPTSTSKEIYELTIPALVNTSDVNALNTASTLQSFDTSLSPQGLVLRSTDGRLYYGAVAGASAQSFRSINTDGTDESPANSTMSWGYVGLDITQVPDDWAASYAGGKNLVAVGSFYGICLQAIDPWNSTVTPTALVKYDATHQMAGYDYSDTFAGVQWITVGSESYLLVAGTDSSEAAATFWFYRASDIMGAAHPYDPQPYMTLSVQDKLFNGPSAKELWGLAYDEQKQILYGYEGGYQRPTIVHAWAVPEPATMTLVVLGGMAVLRRRPRKD